ncbi:MAG: HYC_CC_PP family protein [Flavobacteriales bacterium]
MKEFSHKILAVLMSFVVLFSTTSFAITKHFCGDTLVDTAIFSEAISCGMESQKTTSKTISGCSIVKTDCCTDEQLLVDGQDEVQLQVDKISFNQELFIASFIYTYINRFENLENNVSSFVAYKPPLVIKEIFKIDETYLI